MQTRLASRLSRVTKEMQRKFPCKICHGKGKWVVTYIRDGQETTPDPEGCPECGETHRIILQYVKVERIER